MGCRRDVGWFGPDLPPITSEANRGIGSANVKRALGCMSAVFGTVLYGTARQYYVTTVKRIVSLPCLQHVIHKFPLVLLSLISLLFLAALAALAALSLPPSLPPSLPLSLTRFPLPTLPPSRTQIHTNTQTHKHTNTSIHKNTQKYTNTEPCALLSSLPVSVVAFLSLLLIVSVSVLITNCA